MLPHGGHFTKEDSNLNPTTNKVMYVDISNLINKLNKINNTDEGEDLRSPTYAVNLLRRISNV